MRFRKLSLLLLSMLFWSWGFSSPVSAASDLQQSQYEVTLTPPHSTLPPLLTGGGGAFATTPVSQTPTTGGSGSLASTPTATSETPTSGSSASQTLSGRLPQLSEQQWAGLGLLSLILILMFLAWRLSRKSRRS